jgi:hypothetical protein
VAAVIGSSREGVGAALLPYDRRIPALIWLKLNPARDYCQTSRATRRKLPLPPDGLAFRYG